jgi:hypothetical protein
MQITNPYLELYEKLDNLASSVNKLLTLQEKKIPSNQSSEIFSEFVFIEEVEILLKMPVSTIRHHIDRHALPCYGATKPLRFRREEVVKWFLEYSKDPEKFKKKPTSILKSK